MRYRIAALLALALSLTGGPAVAQQQTGVPVPMPVLNGGCLIGASNLPAWGSCSGTGAGIVGPGTTTDGYVPLWSGTTGSALQAGLPVGTSGVSTILETAGTGLLDVASVVAAGAITNTMLANSSMTLAGHLVALGGTQTFAASDLTNGTIGSGAVVLATSPTLVTPALGTPSALDLLHATDLQPSAIPGPTLTTFGGVLSYVSPTHQVINAIATTTGQPSSIQLGFGDLSGTASPAQLPLCTGSIVGAVPTGGSTTTFLRGDCTWVAALTGPGSSTNGYLPQWSGTSGIALSAGLPVGLTGVSTVVETTSGGLLTASLLPLCTGSVIGAVPTGGSGTTFLRGDCTWATPAGAGNVSGPGSSTNAYLPQWNGTTGTLLSTGLPVGLTGNSTVVETTSGGLLTASLLPVCTGSVVGGVPTGGSTSTFLRGDCTWQTSATSFADPTAAMLCGTVVAGTATTAMRSDAAFALPSLTGGGLSAGSYTNTNLTVDACGRITAAANGTVPTGANPTATIGASATNGTATTFMRSDAAPAIGSHAVTNALLATMLTNTIKGNATSGTAAPTDLAIGSCSGATNGLIWTTNTGFGCNTYTIPAGANPTATMACNSAVNGTATTWLRSDGSPALPTTAVTAGSYTAATLTVDACGRLTAASSNAQVVSGPGSSTNGYLPLWSGTTGRSLGLGLPVGLTGNSTVVETTSGGLLTASLLPACTGSIIGGVPIGGSTSTFLRGDCTWQAVPFTALSGTATFSQLPNVTGPVIIGRVTATSGVESAAYTPSNGTDTAVALVHGAITSGHCADFSDTGGSVADSGGVCSGAPTFFVGATAGSANTYTLATPTPSGFTLTAGLVVRATISAANTTTSTLSVAGTAAKPIVKNGALGALTGGELLAAGQIYDFTYSTSSSGACAGGCYIVSNAAPGSRVAGTTQTISAAQWYQVDIFTATTASQTLTLLASTSYSLGGAAIIQTRVAVTLAPSGTDNLCTPTCANSSFVLPAGLTVFVTTDGAGNFDVSPTTVPIALANPTALVGSGAACNTVTNGSAATAMRSDAQQGLATTAVSAGSYTKSNITVDACGRLTAASSGVDQQLTASWAAGITPTHSFAVHIPATMTISAIYGWVDTVAGATETVDVYEVPSGTACSSSGTKMNTTSFNANGTVNTEQSLGVTTSTITAGDTLCIVQATGTSTASAGSISIWAH